MTYKVNLADLEMLWVLGLLKLNELPTLIASTLENGHESESTLQLAICNSDDDVSEIQNLFVQVLNESGYGNLSKENALRKYGEYISKKLLLAEITPYEGANLIWDATIHTHLTEFHDLDPFIYCASEMQDRPDDREFFEKAIMQEAAKWI